MISNASSSVDVSRTDTNDPHETSDESVYPECGMPGHENVTHYAVGLVGSETHDELLERSSAIISRLPKADEDLLIENNQNLIDTIATYEMLRRFAVPLQLSPFRFEDFCASIVSPIISPLLCEIHLTLLRLLHKDNEENGVTFTHNDLKSSYEVMFILALDYMTWPAVLLQFAEGNNWPAYVMAALGSVYPFCDYKRRLIVIRWMCELTLRSNAVRRVFSLIDNSCKGYIASQQTQEEHCRICLKRNSLIYCSRCSAAFHCQCLDPVTENQSNEGPLVCAVCQSCNVKGVADVGQCPFNPSDSCLRLEVIGYDSGLNRYIFAAHRLIIESFDGETVLYYSLFHKVCEIEAILINDEQCKRNQNYRYNSNQHLIERMQSIREFMNTQMKLTLELTIERRTGMANTHENQPYISTESWLESKVNDTYNKDILKDGIGNAHLNAKAFKSQVTQGDTKPEDMFIPQFDGCYSDGADSYEGSVSNDHIKSDFEQQISDTMSIKAESFLEFPKLNASPTLDMTAIDCSPDSTDCQSAAYDPDDASYIDDPAIYGKSLHVDIIPKSENEHFTRDVSSNLAGDGLQESKAWKQHKYKDQRDWRRSTFNTERITRTTTGTIKPLAYDLMDRGKLSCSNIDHNKHRDFVGTSVKRAPSEFTVTIPHRKFTRYGRPPRSQLLTSSCDGINLNGQTTKQGCRRNTKRQKFATRKSSIATSRRSSVNSCIIKRELTKSTSMCRLPTLPLSESDDSELIPNDFNFEDYQHLSKCTYPSLIGEDAIADSLLLKRTMTKDTAKLLKLMSLGSSKELFDLLIHNRHELAIISQNVLSGINSDGLYRLGNDHTYLQYVNQYASHKYCQSKINSVHFREKRNLISRKYSVDADIDWSLSDLIKTEVYPKRSKSLILGRQPLSAGVGDRSHLLRLVCIAMISLECKISPFFMHREWHSRRIDWAASVTDCTEPVHLAKLLLDFESSIKPMSFHPSYICSLCSSIWLRESSEFREQRKTEDASQRRQIEADLAEVCQHSVNVKKIRSTLGKLRGEEYRMLGGGWCWDRVMCQLDNPNVANCHTIKDKTESLNERQIYNVDSIETFNNGPYRIENYKGNVQRSNPAVFEIISYDSIHPILSEATETVLDANKYNSPPTKLINCDIATHSRQLHSSILDGLLEQREKMQITLKGQLDASLKSLQIRFQQDTKELSEANANYENASSKLETEILVDPGAQCSCSTSQSIEQKLLKEGKLLNDGYVLVAYNNETLKLPMCVNYPRLPFKLSQTGVMRTKQPNNAQRPNTYYSDNHSTRFYRISDRARYLLARKAAKGNVPGFKESRHPMWIFPFCKPVQQLVWRWRTSSASCLAQVALQLKLLCCSLTPALFSKSSLVNSPFCEQWLTNNSAVIYDRRDVGENRLCSEYLVEYKTTDIPTDIAYGKRWVSEIQLPIATIHAFNYALEKYRLLKGSHVTSQQTESDTTIQCPTPEETTLTNFDGHDNNPHTNIVFIQHDNDQSTFAADLTNYECISQQTKSDLLKQENACMQTANENVSIDNSRTAQWQNLFYFNDARHDKLKCENLSRNCDSVIKPELNEQHVSVMEYGKTKSISLDQSTHTTDDGDNASCYGNPYDELSSRHSSGMSTPISMLDSSHAIQARRKHKRNSVIVINQPKIEKNLVSTSKTVSSVTSSTEKIENYISRPSGSSESNFSFLPTFTVKPQMMSRKFQSRPSNSSSIFACRGMNPHMHKNIISTRDIRLHNRNLATSECQDQKKRISFINTQPPRQMMTCNPSTEEKRHVSAAQSKQNFIRYNEIPNTIEKRKGARFRKLSDLPESSTSLISNIIPAMRHEQLFSASNIQPTKPAMRHEQIFSASNIQPTKPAMRHEQIFSASNIQPTKPAMRHEQIFSASNIQSSKPAMRHEQIFSASNIQPTKPAMRHEQIFSASNIQLTKPANERLKGSIDHRVKYSIQDNAPISIKLGNDEKLKPIRTSDYSRTPNYIPDISAYYKVKC